MTTDRPPPGDDRTEERRRLERTVREAIKKLVESSVERLADGYERIAEGPENVREFVKDLRLPKEVLQLLLTQVDETKNGLYRVVAREIRDFLEHTNLAEELSRALTSLSFEIKTEVRFIPNDARSPRPEVKARVRVKRAGEDAEPDAPEREERS